MEEARMFTQKKSVTQQKELLMRDFVKYLEDCGVEETVEELSDDDLDLALASFWCQFTKVNTICILHLRGFNNRG